MALWLRFARSRYFRKRFLRVYVHGVMTRSALKYCRSSQKAPGKQSPQMVQMSKPNPPSKKRVLPHPLHNFCSILQKAAAKKRTSESKYVSLFADSRPDVDVTFRDPLLVRTWSVSTT